MIGIYNVISQELINDCFKLYPGTPDGNASCARFLKYPEQHCRHDKAKEQLIFEKVEINEIIYLVNELLENTGLTPVTNPIFNNPVPLSSVKYENFKNANQLYNTIGEIFIRFTADGYIGVIGKDFKDINFQIPNDESDYTKRTYKQKVHYIAPTMFHNSKKDWNWTYNTAGILLHHLAKTWDTSFVLLFPLSPKSTNPNPHFDPNRRDTDYERAIGNYLIKKGVPIIDFYSHNY